MIKYVKGSIFDSKCEALVNPVNCVGVMGKGLALEFKNRFPENYSFYKECCEQGWLRMGIVLSYHEDASGVTIVNFPTKKHWKNKSNLQDMKVTLNALVNDVKQRGFESIAIPALGCGLGGLNWNDVSVLIEDAFADLSDVYVELYEPE